VKLTTYLQPEPGSRILQGSIHPLPHISSYGGVDVQIHISLILALVGGEWPASHHCCFTPRERAPTTHWMGGWVGPGAGLDDVEKRKFLTLLGLQLDPSVIQPIASRYTDYTIMAPHISSWYNILPLMVQTQFDLC
jgi:hypothetical protein